MSQNRDVQVIFGIPDDEDDETRDIVPLTFPQIRPECAAGLYMSSRLYIDELVKNYPRLPPSDVARDSLCIDLVHSRKLLEEANKRLETRREVARHHDPKIQTDMLKELQQQLRENFIEFDSFIRENQEKRDRAAKKLIEDKLVLINKQVEIDEMNEKRTKLLEAKSLLEHKIAEYRKYENFLEKAVKLAPNQFKHADEILQRYDALSQARRLLGARHDQTLIKLETARSDLAKVVEEKTLILMGLDNKMMGLRSRYEEAMQNSLMWEALVQKIEAAACTTKGKINQVKDSCYAIYKSMCKRKNILVDLKKEDFENQLIFIKRTLKKLKGMTEEAHRQMANEINSLKVEQSKSLNKTGTVKNMSMML